MPSFQHFLRIFGAVVGHVTIYLLICLRFHVDTCVCLLFVYTVMYIVMYTEMHKQCLKKLLLVFVVLLFLL
jgi:hypothetical protein